WALTRPTPGPGDTPTPPSALAPTATPSPTPRPPTPTPTQTKPPSTAYATLTPGANCDAKGGMWRAINSTTQCSTNRTVTAKTRTWAGDASGGETEFYQRAGQPLPSDFSVRVKISDLTDPIFPASSTDAGACAGFALNLSSDGTTADVVEVCANGYMDIVN